MLHAATFERPPEALGHSLRHAVSDAPWVRSACLHASAHSRRLRGPVHAARSTPSRPRICVLYAACCVLYAALWALCGRRLVSVCICVQQGHGSGSIASDSTPSAGEDRSQSQSGASAPPANPTGLVFSYEELKARLERKQFDGLDPVRTECLIQSLQSGQVAPRTRTSLASSKDALHVSTRVVHVAEATGELFERCRIREDIWY
jgi:hypothetical protein